MRRSFTICTFWLIMIFLVTPSITNAAPNKNKAKRTDSSRTISKKSSTSAKQLKSHDRVVKKDSRNSHSRRAIRGQVREVQSEPVIYENDGEYIEYKVKRGDTIDKIAALFSVEKDELIETNELASIKKLAPGKTILIPKIIEENEDSEAIVTFKSVPMKPWKNNDEKYMLVKVAKSFMGAPYKYGGNTLRGLDCSAYVKKIYEIFDVQLPRSAREQYTAGTKIGRSDLAAGDLVFFKTRRYAKYPTHVGIFIGDGNFIHASSGKGKLGVKIDSLSSDYYSRAYIGGTRIKGNSDSVNQGSGNMQADKSTNNS
ncbi:MAG: cell wall-associated hydrolase [Deltaproteobacteria bacterium]|nr:cell wall-associated hydrolase [Deltaproteobacteria bacterium]